MSTIDIFYVLQNNMNLSVNFLKSPITEEIVLFSCDDLYFKKFGIYNICSCSEVGHDVHVNIINPSSESINLIEKLKNKLKINLSVSLENYNTENLNQNAIISYYFCSRFFIASLLFKNYAVKKIHIVDTDMIFNKKITMNNEIHLSLEYNKEYNNLWQKTMAGYIFITIEKLWFLEEVIQEYQHRYSITDFEKASTIQDKVEKANYVALDQVCLSYVIEKENLENYKYFYNLLPVRNEYKSKGDNEAMMWMILGKTKNNIEPYLKEKFKKYFT